VDVLSSLEELCLEQLQLEADRAQLVLVEKFQVLIGSTVGRRSQQALKAFSFT
jgi:hypothetical protein